MGKDRVGVTVSVKIMLAAVRAPLIDARASARTDARLNPQRAAIRRRKGPRFTKIRLVSALPTADRVIDGAIRMKRPRGDATSELRSPTEKHALRVIRMSIQIQSCLTLRVRAVEEGERRF